MASQTRNVVRYTALLSGIAYGFVHQGTLQKTHDEEKVKHQFAHRQHLIEEAKKAYAAKLVAEKAGGAKEVITNIDDPKFDLEKLLEAWTQGA
ncbi:hypothetical protein EHS25_007711 [Saitozyma podzolica]|uniref:ATP synthase F(0) complex subunit e, mitochondrial n=1 Tax=Saitozyma podzolica TaxID=1890683 RepID=A0A427YQL1_9TREE|nr:hypothetical protein EHS25_007711 [Saitozyma podzolica]